MVPVRKIEHKASDDDLLQEYQSTLHQISLSILYLRYTDLVYGICMKYLKDAEASKDGVMNIYLDLVAKLQTQKVNNFKSWLYGVAKNHCLMQLRKSKQAIVLEFQTDLMQADDFLYLDTILEKEKELQKLEKCINELDSKQNEIIKLFYLENKCYSEIATTTGLEWNKVRSILQNGRRNLKICMEKND